MRQGESLIRRLVCLAAVAALGAACSGQGSHPTAPSLSAPAAQDSHTAAALLAIARVFNNDYDRGVYGPVWDRWDARSKAIITRIDYIRRHTECPDSPQLVTVVDARHGSGGAWIVDYETGGVQLHDYWFYEHGRWVFDLPLSNPSSVPLYKLSPQKYVAQLGCQQ